MKVLIKTAPPKRILRWILQWIHVALFAAGILMLGYCAFVVADTWIFQKQEAAALESFAPQALVPSPAVVGPAGLDRPVASRAVGRVRNGHGRDQR